MHYNIPAHSVNKEAVEQYGNVPIGELVKMPAPKVEDSLSKGERKLVAEIQTLKLRLVDLEWNELERKKAQKKIENLSKFPAENPYPVLRISSNGMIQYANAASTGLLKSKHSGIDQPAPQDWMELTKRVLNTGAIETTEMEHAGHTFVFWVVPVIDGNYCNLYGVDITERKNADDQIVKLAKFPAENPNPVLRVSCEGEVNSVNSCEWSLFVSRHQGLEHQA
jgi:hypothetical protein